MRILAVIGIVLFMLTALATLISCLICADFSEWPFRLFVLVAIEGIIGGSAVVIGELFE